MSRPRGRPPAPSPTSPPRPAPPPGAPGGPAGGSAPAIVAVAAIAVLELAWLAWFLIVPLPNAGNVGGVAVRRGLLLMRALPEVVPGVGYEQSLLGLALKELSHVENLPQRVPIALTSALVASAALGLGGLALRALGLRDRCTAAERWPLAFGVGASGLGVATLLLGRAGWLAPWPVRAALAALAACAMRDAALDLARAPRPRPAPGTLLAAAAVAPFLLIMALGAMLPTIDFDAIEYHLEGPKEYFQAGRIAFLPHNVYTSMPFGVEMLHLLGMEVAGDWWAGALAGQLLVAAFAPAAAALVGATAGRLGSPRAGRVAAVAYLTTPWIYRLAVIPYVEGPLCYYHAALVWAVARTWGGWGGERPARSWALIGLLAGGAMACKYPGLISAVLPAGALAVAASARARAPRLALAFALGWAAVMAPWLAKNVVDTGNPVYPLGYKVFGGRHWDAARDAKWSAAHGPRGVSAAALVEAIGDVAGRSDWQSPLFAALAPLALLRPGSRRPVLALGAYAGYLFLTWWLLTHRLDRFWLPLLPALAVLAGLGSDWARGRAWSALLGVLLAISVVANLAYASTALAGLNEWTGDLRALRSEVPALINPPLARLDAELPPGAKVLLVGQAMAFHLRHPVAYNTVFDVETIEALTEGRTPAQALEALRGGGITHVYVDWSEIERYRRPGNYGFTPYVTAALFERLVASGVLEGPEPWGAGGQELYRVRAAGRE